MSKNKEVKDMSDHDLLIRLNERVDHIYETLGMHLKHHWAFFIGATMLILGILIKAGK